MKRRNISRPVQASLADTRVVFIGGPRQAGKTTLALALASEHGLTALSLDDAAVFDAASRDPAGFIAGQPTPLMIDEIQRVPALFRVIKTAVDRNTRPGQFLLTGSSSISVLPALAESLAGRMEIHTLWPLSAGELLEREESFIARVFGERLPKLAPAPNSANQWERILTGGYPEVVQRQTAERRRAWFNAYLTTVLQREVRDLSAIADLAAMPRVLGLIAARGPGLLNSSALGRDASVPNTTLRRYLALLEGTFLIHLLPAWARNPGKRLVRAPKPFITDAGLMASLLGVDAARLQHDGFARGALLETFVAMELLKQTAWSRPAINLYHFRTHGGAEVDLVLEDAAGRVVGIEVKATAAPGRGSLTGLTALADAAGSRFVRGIVLYGGDAVVPFGERVHAVPWRALWEW